MSNAADEARLLDQHADVLFRMDTDGKLAGLNEPGDDPPPRLFLARDETTHRLWFRTPRLSLDRFARSHRAGRRRA